MPDFIKTQFEGKLSYIGRVKSRPDDLKSEPMHEAQLTLDGIEGEYHGGRTRPSCNRVSMIYPVGTIIANARQFCIMSDEELAEIAQLAEINENRPEWWGASLSIKGIPELSALPPSSRLRFPSGATIRVDVENAPCRYTAQETQSQTGGDPVKIKAAAKNRRGLVGSVEREGIIQIGDTIELFVPNARPHPAATS